MVVISRVPQAIVVTGVAGSGKSTAAQALARHYGDVFVDADAFHSMEAKAQMAAGIPLTDAQREPWVAALVDEVRRHAREGHSVVLAFSGLRAAHRQRLRESGVPMRFVYLHASPAVIAARLAVRRDHFACVSLLESQWRDLEPPTGEAGVVVVDVDAPESTVLARLIAALDAAP